MLFGYFISCNIYKRNPILKNIFRANIILDIEIQEFRRFYVIAYFLLSELKIFDLWSRDFTKHINSWELIFAGIPMNFCIDIAVLFALDFALNLMLKKSLSYDNRK